MNVSIELTKTIPLTHTTKILIFQDIDMETALAISAGLLTQHGADVDATIVIDDLMPTKRPAKPFFLKGWAASSAGHWGHW